MNKKQIDKVLQSLIKKANSTDIGDIISYLDIKIKKENLKTFSYKKENSKYIVLDIDTPEEIEEFIIAHEIGHLVLHDDFELCYYSPLTANKTEIEREADYFAFKLLRKEIDLSYDFTTEQYAKLLEVNEEIIEYILK